MLRRSNLSVPRKFLKQFRTSALQSCRSVVMFTLNCQSVCPFIPSEVNMDENVLSDDWMTCSVVLRYVNSEMCYLQTPSF